MYFDINAIVEVNLQRYKVVGVVTFSNMFQRENWTEYTLESEKDGKLCWLQENEEFQEYILFTNREFFIKIKEEGLFSGEFTKYKTADLEVVISKGMPYASNGDGVKCRKFQDEMTGRVIEYKGWPEEEEYSIGYFVKRNNVKVVKIKNNIDFDGELEEGIYGNIYEYDVIENSEEKRFIKNSYIFFGVIIVIFMLILGVRLVNSVKGEQIKDLMVNNNKFQYKTSMSSEGEIADIYSSQLAIEDIAEIFRKKGRGISHYAKDDNESGAIAIITDEEYCIIYKNQLGISLVQVSSRLFTYTSESAPYDSTKDVEEYYKEFYHTFGYNDDASEFTKFSSPYKDYKR